MSARKKASTTEPSFEITSLGRRTVTSPLVSHKSGVQFVSDDRRIVKELDAAKIAEVCSLGKLPVSMELAGPREKIYFDPSKTKAAIVACGGLCPGINSVIRSIVLELHFNYGVKNILGVKFGLEGFIPEYGHEVIELDPARVVNVHGRGGCFLGMSRGPQDIGQVVDALERMNISLLFTIGGDGTLRASTLIAEEIQSRGLKTGVVTVPKTIDNDIAYVSRTFGFDSAVEAATRAILSAHNEATSLPHGIGLVKVMGRYAGFVAAQATLALADVNFCLIPEVLFDLEGPGGLLEALRERVVDRGHAVIVVAEGAGQRHFDEGERRTDPSGNVQLNDIGTFLRDRIKAYFSEVGLAHTLKYIDPSYMIRSVAANPIDRVFCGFLGQNAVHAGMAGKTAIMISSWNSTFVHVPMLVAATAERRVKPDGALWRAVREVTGQSELVN